MERKCFSRLVAFLAAVFFSHLVWAQADRPFVPDGQEQKVQVAKRTVLYPFDEYEYDRYNIKKAADDRIPYKVLLDDIKKKKKVSRDCAMEVVGFARTGEETDFDLYIVRDDEGLYYLEAAACPDRWLIDAKNAAIRDEYEKMKDLLAEKKGDFDYRVSLKRAEIQKELAAIEEWNKGSAAVVDSIVAARVAAKESAQKEKYDAWYAGLSPSAKKAAAVIRIGNSELDSPNSAAGCDYILWYDNLSSKTVKYLNWSGYVYNAVGDKVACTIRNQYLFNGRSTGPVGPGERGGGVWEAVIYNWSAKEMRLSSINIQYMDGSSVNISGADARAVTGSPSPFVTATEKRKLKDEALAEYRKTYRTRKDLWSQRESWAKNTDYPSAPVADYFGEEIALRDEIRDLEKELAKYAKRNYIK